MTTDYDFVIVGGGIAGLSAAYHLAKDGHKVAVLEATNSKDGASFASTAEMNHDPDADWDQVLERFGIEGARKVWEVSDIAIAALTDFAHQKGERHFGTRRLPAHIFSHKDGDTEELRKKYEFYKSIGAEVTFLEDARAFNPNFKSVVTILNEGETNNQEMVAELGHDLREQGGEIHHHQKVTSITPEGDGVRVVTEQGMSVSAKRVIIATGDGQGLTPVADEIERMRTFVVSLKMDAVPDLYKESVLWDTDEPFQYIRSISGTRLWVGGQDVKESEYDPATEKPKHAALEKYAKEVLGIDVPYEVDSSWSGVFFESKRGLPYIGDVEGSPISLSVGFGGSGILTSFVSGYLHAAWLRGELLEYKYLFAI